MSGVLGVVMAKVYVSSTIADLTEERRAVLDGLRLARHQAVDSYLPDSPEHPYSLATRANLARWTGEAGNPAGARDVFAELLPVRERILGPEHPRTLATRHELARWTRRADGGPRTA